VLGSVTAAGLGLLGAGAAGVAALDADLQDADRPVHQQLVRDGLAPQRPLVAPPPAPAYGPRVKV
jgi:hypothetical protein